MQKIFFLFFKVDNFSPGP